jgi:hypothetical protein
MAQCVRLAQIGSQQPNSGFQISASWYRGKANGQARTCRASSQLCLAPPIEQAMELVFSIVAGYYLPQLPRRE